MQGEQLEEALSALWLWVAAPLTAIAAIVVTVVLRAPQLTQLRTAIRALGDHDPSSEGKLTPLSTVMLSAAASHGAAGAIGAATAVSLGGAGAIAWIWLFGLLLAPLRMAESVLARTTPPGRVGAPTGSLAVRMLEGSGSLPRLLGGLLLVLVPLTGFAYAGGTQGEAVLEAAEQLLPGSALVLGLTVAAGAALLALAPLQRIGTALGWMALFALLAMLLAALVAVILEPARGLAALGQAVISAVNDAPRTGAFSGALAGEIAAASIRHLLPPIAAPGGMHGGLDRETASATTRGHAATALLGTLIATLVATVVAVSLIATDAFSERTDDTRALSEVRFYDIGAGFETLSQRLETDRLVERGLVRAPRGRSLVDILVATERGMVRDPRFEEASGSSANLAIGLEHGRAHYLQSPSNLGVLTNRADTDLEAIRVRGEMLPRGGRLVAVSMTRAGGAVGARVALASVLLLAMLGAVAWGVGVRKTLEARLTPQIARYFAVLPALGLASAIGSFIPRLGAIGTAAAALTSAVVAIAILFHAREVAATLAPRRFPASKDLAHANEPKKKKRTPKKRKR